MSKKDEIGKAFDFRLFKRVFSRTRPYRGIFWLVAIAAILSAAFAIGIPLLVKTIINESLENKDAEQLLQNVLFMLAFLLGQVTTQLLFSFE